MRQDLIAALWKFCLRVQPDRAIAATMLFVIAYVLTVLAFIISMSALVEFLSR